mmetsp:Transcript_27424/g.73787  ORF Transcript_27424/g.73787 Transcript_27424/m.73787 type:complete len:163 (+) Transcript_27424:1131-1619(+)
MCTPTTSASRVGYSRVRPQMRAQLLTWASTLSALACALSSVRSSTALALLSMMHGVQRHDVQLHDIHCLYFDALGVVNDNDPIHSSDGIGSSSTPCRLYMWCDIHRPPRGAPRPRSTVRDDHRRGRTQAARECAFLPHGALEAAQCGTQAAHYACVLRLADE